MIGPTASAAPDPLAALTAAGVSVWLDDLSRLRLTSGSLAALVAIAHVRGITTMPEAMLRAVADHAQITGDTVHGSYPDPRGTLAALAEFGVDYDDVVTGLERDGLATFADSWNQLSTALDQQLHDRRPLAAAATPPAGMPPGRGEPR